MITGTLADIGFLDSLSDEEIVVLSALLLGELEEYELSDDDLEDIIVLAEQGGGCGMLASGLRAWILETADNQMTDWAVKEAGRQAMKS